MNKKILSWLIGVIMICSSFNTVCAASVDSIDLSGYSDEEMLAYYLEFEGGEPYERLLIAEVIMANVTDEKTLEDVLNNQLYGMSNELFDKAIQNFDNTNLELAKIAIENHQAGNDTKFDKYIAKCCMDRADFNIRFLSVSVRTENYIFTMDSLIK